MNEYQCYKCNYVWENRTKKPKSCPKCKIRLDYVFKEKVAHPNEEGVKIIDEKKDRIIKQRKQYLWGM